MIETNSEQLVVYRDINWEKIKLVYCCYEKQDNSQQVTNAHDKRWSTL